MSGAFRVIALGLCASLTLTSCATSALFTASDPKPKNGKKSPVSQEKIATAALPFALAFDVATLPLQLAAVGIYQAAKPKQPNETSALEKKQRTTKASRHPNEL